jgi:predicted component of type VI protein secretion system
MLKQNVTFIVLLTLLFPCSSFAQNGPGGIGSTNGTSALTVWLTADMGTSTTTNGQRVSSWTDQSGYNNTVTNSGSTSSRPVYNTNGSNSMPYLAFTGGQFLEIGSQSSLNSSNSTVFVVAEGTLSGTSVSMAQSGINQEMLIRDEGLFHHASSGNFRNRTHHCVANIPNSNARILTASFGTAATSLDLHINSLLTTNGISSGTNTPFAAVNRNLRIGRRSNGEFLSGNIYEVIVYSGVLNATDRQAVEEYLRCKYNIDYTTGCGASNLISTITAVGCHGASTGSITLTGGNSSYTYDIGSGPQTSNTFGGLAAGNYTITISDTSNSCPSIINATVTEPTPISISITNTSASATASSTGGTSPYTYLWSNGQISATAVGLSPNVLYQVTTTDANGCMSTDTITLVPGSGPGGVGDTTGNSNLKVWLSADRGTNTTANGQRVNSWMDQSGYNNNATNSSTTTSRPVYGNNGSNNQPYLTFSGAQYLEMSTRSSLNSPTSTVFVVAEGSLSGTSVSMAQSGINQEMLIRSEVLFHHASSGNFRTLSHNCVANIPNNDARILTANFGTAATNLNLYVNGQATTSNISGGTNIAYGTVNRNLRIGRRSVGEFLNGNVYEVIVYSGTLDSADRSAVEEYLRCKYDIINNTCGTLNSSPCGNITTINNIQESTLKIYPNPVQHQLQVELTTPSNLATHIQVTNTMGQVVLQKMTTEQQIQIDVQNLPSGIYIMQALQDAQVIATQKFTKN